MGSNEDLALGHSGTPTLESSVMHTEVILTKNVQGLGAEGDKVSVAPGYARNYLIPRGIAKLATEASLKHIEILQKKRAEREAAEKVQAEETITKINKLICKITVKTGQQDKMFGAVTAGDILDFLTKQGLLVERKQIVLERPIHQLGDHQVAISLAHGVTAQLKVQVVAAEPPPAPAAPVDRRGPRRGERPEKAHPRAGERRIETKGKPPAKGK